MQVRTIFILAGLIAIGCNDDDPSSCPETTDLGAFDLLQASVDKFPYGMSDTYAIFSDADGTEIMGEISSIMTEYAADTVPVQCPQALTVNVEVTARTEQIRTTLVFPGPDKVIDIRHRVAPLYGLSLELTQQSVADLATIVIYDLGSNPPEISALHGITVTIDRRTWPFDPIGTAILQSSVSLDGKAYEDVYSAATGNGDYQLYYSFADGLVAFEDLVTGDIYKFERIE